MADGQAFSIKTPITTSKGTREEQTFYGYKSGFPSCCGIVVISELAPVRESDYISDELLAVKEQLLEQAMAATTKDMMLMYTVAGYQHLEHEMLKKHGFRELYEFKNPNSENMVTIYGKQNTKEA